MPEPAVTDRATIAAHLAAFGSANVRSLYQAGRSAITAIETEEAALRWKVNDDYPGPRSIRDLKGSPEVLQPEELAARQALGGRHRRGTRPPVAMFTVIACTRSAKRAGEATRPAAQTTR
jgi:hypothetical protein